MDYEPKTIAVEFGAFNNPIFENHKRGRNWAAEVTGKNAANCDKRFLKKRGAIIDLEGIAPGAVIEIAGDYTTARGGFRPDRRYWLVRSLSETEMKVEEWPSLAKAMKAAHAAKVAADIFWNSAVDGPKPAQPSSFYSPENADVI